MAIMELLHTTKEAAEKGGISHASAEFLVLLSAPRPRQPLNISGLIATRRQ